MWKKIKKRGPKVALISLGVLVAVTLVLWLCLPMIASYMLRQQLDEVGQTLDREVSFEDLELHGLSGVDIHGLSIAGDRGKKPALEVGRLEVRFDGALIWGGAKVDVVHLIEPVVRVERDAEGRTNIGEIIDRLRSMQEPESDSPQRMPTLRISDGALRMNDAREGLFNLESIDDLTLEVTPIGDDGAAIDATLRARFHFDPGGPQRAEQLRLSGRWSPTEGARASLIFEGGGAALPLDGHSLIPGLRLRELAVTLPPATDVEAGAPPFALADARVALRYRLGPLEWWAGSPLTELSWLEQLVHGPTLEGSGTPEGLSATDEGGQEASSVRAWTHGEPPDFDALRPMLISGEMYRESWTLRGEGDTYDIETTIFISNMGFGDGKATVKGALTPKSGDAPLVIDAAFSAGEWSVSETGLTMTLGDWTLAGEPEKFTLAGVAGEGDDAATFSLTFSGVGWRPGTGWVLFGETNEMFQRDLMPVVNGELRGEVTRGEVVEPVSGRGGVRLVTANIAPNKMMSDVVYFVDHVGLLHVEWKKVQPSSNYDQAPFGYLLIAYDNRVIFSSLDVDVDASNPFTDPGNFNYTVPRNFVVESTNNAGEAVRLTLESDTVTPSNPLDRLPPLQRGLASQMVKPTEFLHDARWTLTLPGLPPESAREGEGTFKGFVIR